MRTADPRDALANAMLPFATELACQVHDWNADAVMAIVRSLTEEGKDALIVVLAALVPVDRPLLDLIAWSHDTKFCPRCRCRKRRSDFHASRASSDGLHGWCKACHNAAKRKPALELLGREAS